VKAPAVLGEDRVRELLDPGRAEELVSEALRAFSAGAARQPVRAVASAGEPVRGYLGAMPGWLPATPSAPETLGLKAVAWFPGNARRGLATHHAWILLFDPETGEPRAFLAAGTLTAVRTAAATAVATRVLASPTARVLAILGTGVQARSHLPALRRVRAFEELRVWSPSREHREAFAREHGCRAVASAEEAVRGADVVTAVTAAAEPVVQEDWLAPGVHLNGVGACRPDQREYDSGCLRGARVFVDSREAARREAGDLILAGVEPEAELGDVLLGRHPGRRSPAERTFFKSLGLAVEDLVCAREILARVGL